MRSASNKLTIGFIPLVDAATLIVAVDKGFAAREGLDVSLVREVSWSNVRDKLNIGLFDAAHLLAPIAIASSLGIGHVKVPLSAPFTLGVNGNAITLTPSLHAAILEACGTETPDPLTSARALARVVADRRTRGEHLLTFGMTFPFSSHNYQLRFWMAAGGVDPDEDVQLVVLPPPYMVGSLASGHVDGFCVGAPWNSVAVEAGTGVILHFGSEILAHALEKVLAVRAGWAEQNTDAVLRLVRACRQAADYIEDDSNHPDVVEMLAAPHRLAVAPDVIRNTLGGRLNVASGGPMRTSNRYVLFARDGAARPDAVQAAWLYAQMVRWRQTPFSPEQLAEAEAVLRPDIYDAAIGKPSVTPSAPSDGIGAFAGPPFDPRDIVAHLSAWTAGKPD